jgi:AraC family transcriptional regulator
MHQNGVLSIAPSPSTPLGGLLKQHLAGSLPDLKDPGLTEAMSASRVSSNGEMASDAKLRRVIADLVNALRSLLQDERESAAEYLRRASEILEVDRERLSPETRQRSSKRAEPARGGLAPWQVRRVTMYIEANLVETIRNRELASMVRLSPFHFCRAFRESFEDSPHSYIVRRRVERAQALMLTTRASLAQIAVSCGIADQAYLSKLFRRLVGETPGSWRRARAATPASAGYAQSPKHKLPEASANPLT